MVYLMDEYYKHYPDRGVLVRPIFDKFTSSTKYLHEYTLEELNKEISTWNPVLKTTGRVRKVGLYSYFLWLKNEHDINIEPEIAKEIIFPVRETKFLIYSTDDLHEIWGELIADIEIIADKRKETPCTDTLLVAYAAGILSFYGMTKEQILSLGLNDVNQHGVAGYDLPLTQKDIDVLTTYKNLDEFSNRMPQKGNGYIRSPKTETPSERFLDGVLGKIGGKCSEDMKQYVKLLTCSSLYNAGMLNELFQNEKKNPVSVEVGNTVPDWFMDIIIKFDSGETLSKTTITRRKKDYIKYRTERIAYQNIMSDRVKGGNAKAINDIIAEINEVITSTSDTNVIERLKTIRERMSNLIK